MMASEWDVQAAEVEWWEDVVHGLFCGLFAGLILYGLSLTPLFVFPAVLVFLIAGCCSLRSWDGVFVFAAAAAVIAARLGDTVRALEP